ncbi:hypothetical protein ACHAPA_010545 [Fusarium lateritium]
MQPMHNDGTGISSSLPTETWMQIICKRDTGLSLGDLMRLCRVNKSLRQMATEAILESDILRHAGYWDPIRKITVRYEPKLRKRHFVCTLGVKDTDSESESGSVLSHGDRYPSMPPDGFEHHLSDDSVSEEEFDSEGHEESEHEDSDESSKTDYSGNSETKQLTPSQDFWIMHLNERTMGRIRSKPPTRDHALLRKVAEYIWQWRLGNSHIQDIPTETEFEDIVRTVCEVAVKFAYIHDRRAFFIGTRKDESESRFTVIDWSCAVFRDALTNVAVFLGDAGLLESILSREYTISCPDHVHADTTSDESNKEPALFTGRIPHVQQVSHHRSAAFKPPECGDSLIRLGSPAKIAVETGNFQFASILLKSLATNHYELSLCRGDIITAASLPEKIDFLRLAIHAGPPLTAYNILLPSLADHLYFSGRSYFDTRSEAGVALSKILETTKDLQVFNLVYDAILAGYNEEEGVWWTKPPKKFSYAAHTLSSWGTKRIQRAVLDDCLPIVQRLFQLGYNLDPNYSPAEASHENRDIVNYMIDSGRTRDTALSTAVRNGNFEMVELLFREGAGRNGKNVRRAIYAAMDIGSNGGDRSTEMLRVLMNQPGLEGLFNRRTRRRFQQYFDVDERKDIWLWLELLTVFNWESREAIW